MPSRRWHQKSHHGCQTCKTRKVKCDETRPICKNCSKQNRPCQYTSEAVVSPPFPGASLSGNTPHYGMIDFQAEEQQKQEHTPPTLKKDSSTDSKTFAESVQTSNEYKLQSLNLSMLFDLELMHHYTRNTYLTITDLDTTTQTWQDAVPKEAFLHPFLMHGILALSAFHLSVLEPRKHKVYSERGMQHYTLALTLYQKVLRNANQSNCHALFAFSSLGAIISFAVSMVSRHTHDEIIKDMKDTFSMLRGIHAVVMVVLPWVQHGPMATLLRAYQAKEYDLPDACIEYLRNLERRVETMESDEGRKKAYFEAIEVGRKALKNAAFDSDDKTLAFTWPIMIGRPYIDALHDNEPMAIAILGLYGVILQDVRTYWWATDRGVKLIEAVRTSLDDSWDDVLRYPVSLMGHSPTARSISQFSGGLERPSFSPSSVSPSMPSIKFEN